MSSLPTAVHLGQRVTNTLRTIVEYLLLRHILGVEIAIFGGGMLAGIYIIFAIWSYQPPLSLNPSPSSTQLSAVKIDALKVWLDARHQELHTPLSLTRKDSFAEKVSP